MKNCNHFIQLILIAGLLFVAGIACDKTDDSGGDIQSAGKVIDADSNVYKTVKIGSQEWMAENLKTTKYNDGTEIPNVTSAEQWGYMTTGAYCNYDNLESNAATYGSLYNWYAVNTGKLAPAGWHVPTVEDWTILENYVAENLVTSVSVGKALAAKTYWTASINDGEIGNDLTINDTTGFTALPGGDRYRTGIFNGIGKNGVWWTSTEYDMFGAYYRYLRYDGNDLGRHGDDKLCGLSVRLVKD